jgi:hypothetical protein
MTTKKTAAKASVKKLAAKKAPANSPDKSGAKAAPKQIAKKPKKKVVRDSFTMPQSEYSKIAEIKAICLKAKMHVKKSEVLRAGLKLLAEQNATQLKHALGSLEKIKTGRPQKH